MKITPNATRLLGLLLASAFAALAAEPTVWIDFNKNEKKDIYEDAAQPIERRIDDLLAQMNVAEKTCQLATLYGYGRVLKDPLPTPEWKNAIWKDGIANIDEMHNGIGKYAKSPYNDTPVATVNALNTIQRWFIEETRLGIPVDFTNEGVRGLNYVRSTNFPSNISLGATWDRDLLTRIGTVIASEARAIGYTSIYAPLLDLARDPRWGSRRRDLRRRSLPRCRTRYPHGARASGRRRHLLAQTFRRLFRAQRRP